MAVGAEAGRFPVICGRDEDSQTRSQEKYPREGPPNSVENPEKKRENQQQIHDDSAPKHSVCQAAPLLFLLPYSGCIPDGTSGDIELFEKPSNINGFWAVGQ